MLIIGIVILNTSCITKIPQPEITVPTEYIVKYKKIKKIDHPSRPKLKNINSNFHIGSSTNINILQKNIEDLVIYSKSLENTINYYESQSDDGIAENNINK